MEYLGLSLDVLGAGIMQKREGDIVVFPKISNQ